jgi:two-component system sensor histidine kinase PilS (NtrC family)
MDATPPPDQNLRILQIYNLYRLALSAILLASFLTNPISTQLGNLVPALFLQSALAYTASSLLVLLVFRRTQHREVPQRLISGLFIGDILALTLLSHASGGVESGLALLHLVTVAAGSPTASRMLITPTTIISSIAVNPLIL